MSEHPEPLYLRGRVATATAVLDGVVVVDGALIAWVGPAADADATGWPEVPAAAARPSTVLPGLVDLHDHGAACELPRCDDSQDVTVADGVARLAYGGSIAGGTAHLLDVLRATVRAGVPLVDAVRAASTTPATVLGDPQVGSLEAGRRADVLVADDDLRVVRVLRAGLVVAP